MEQTLRCVPPPPLNPLHPRTPLVPSSALSSRSPLSETLPPGSRSKYEAERIAMEQRLKATYESDRSDLEKQFESRLSQIRAELEDEERMQKRKMVDATDLLVAEFKKQMEV